MRRPLEGIFESYILKALHIKGSQQKKGGKTILSKGRVKRLPNFGGTFKKDLKDLSRGEKLIKNGKMQFLGEP